MSRKILVVDDEKPIVDLISFNLKKEGHEVIEASDGEQAYEKALAEKPDLILLDVMLPKKDGFEILKKLKEERISTQIIMITAKSEMIDKLNGLENGADDYITKPFHMRELVARIKIVLRRNINIENDSILEYGDLNLNLSTGTMSSNGNEIAINGKELELLETLMLNKNQIVTKEVLISKIWGFDSSAEYNYVEVYACFLRKKLKLLKSKAKIKVIRGTGYKFEEEND